MYYEKHRAAPAGSGRRAVLCAGAAAAVLFALINIRAQSLIRPAVEACSASMFTRAVSEAVCSAADRESVSPVKLSVGADGTVTAVETDAAAVNRIKSMVSLAALDAISEGRCCADIPAGSLTGLPLLMGRGPSVRIKLRPAGGVESELYSTFEDAGINQTRHRIICSVSAKVRAMLPGFDIPLELSTDVLIAESVVVGRVPDSYTNVIGDKSDTVGRIFDYAEPGK